jgi:hypothetical protein
VLTQGLSVLETKSILGERTFFLAAPVLCRMARHDGFSAGHEYAPGLARKCNVKLGDPTSCNGGHDEP